VPRRVGRVLNVPALVRHARDDQAQAGPGVAPRVDEVQLACTVADQYGGEGGAEAATGVEFLWSAHSMSGSACSSTEDGIVRPRALAVLRLITSANLVGCSTGRSAGFAPL